jgi:signal transduction histidine kinase
LTVVVAGGRFVATVRDVTGRKDLERRARDAAALVERQIGEDLHDNVGQQLTGLGLMVDALAAGGPPAAGGLVGKIAEALRRIRADVRRLATGLVPVGVPPEGFGAVLEDLAAQVRDQCRVGCECVTVGDPRLPDSAAATHLFRIAQEAVSNALRHGRATAIRITLRGEPGAVTMEVRDNGAGFSPGEGGLGIRLMRDRAARIGGELAVAPTDGGTVVTVRTPAAPSA